MSTTYAKEWDAQRARPGDRRLMIKGVDAVVYFQQRESGEFFARGYAGRTIKPNFNYRFRSAAKLSEYVAKWRDGLVAHAQRMTEAKTKAKEFRHTLKVGDVLYCSWGYDQTNIDYYQVTALHGEHMITAQEIEATAEGTGWEQGRSVPSLGSFTGKPKKYRVQSGNAIRVASYARAYPLEFTTVAGAKVYQSQAWTSYA